MVGGNYIQPQRKRLEWLPTMHTKYGTFWVKKKIFYFLF